MNISIPDFIRWIMSNSWNMHHDSSERAVKLVSEIHLLLAERDDLSLDDSMFLSELITLDKALNTQVFNITEANEPQVVYVFRPLSPSYRDLPLVSVSL